MSSSCWLSLGFIFFIFCCYIIFGVLYIFVVVIVAPCVQCLCNFVFWLFIVIAEFDLTGRIRDLSFEIS